MKLLGEFHASTGAKKVLNSELWHACAGPLVSLPQPRTLVLYFPQGHSEQVSSSTRRNINSQIPSYSILPSQLMCQVHNVTLHADRESDEIYAQIMLLPVNSEADVLQIPDFGYTKSMRPTEFFCKSLTASDTSTHGGFSVPRRAAEKLFPPLDFTMQPPNQELSVRDLHDNIWTFRHIYRGQPKRHLLTTGWSLFVGAKRLKAGDSVLFIRDEKSQLLLGLRRANSQLATFPSSVLSADSMHIGVLAAAAHAVASRNSFTVYYNPKACPSEFIIPLAKYHKAAFMHVSAGVRFGMMFATEELIKRRNAVRSVDSRALPAPHQPPSADNLYISTQASSSSHRKMSTGVCFSHQIFSEDLLAPSFKLGEGHTSCERMEKAPNNFELHACDPSYGSLEGEGHTSCERMEKAPNNFELHACDPILFWLLNWTMGTIVGVSDLDSLRWPNSKWRNLEVEWDEPSSDDKPDRVSIWEIEAHESLFVVPSCLKRHCNSGFVEYISGNLHILKSNLDSERLIKSLKPRNYSGREIGFSESVFGTILKNIKANDLPATSSSALPSIMASQGDVLHEAKKFEIVKMDKKIPLFLQEQPLALEETSFECKNTYHCLEQQRLFMETKRESQFSSKTPWRSCQEQNVKDNCYDGVFGKEIVTEIFSVGSKKKRIVPIQNKVETTSDLTGNSERPRTATPPGNEIIKKETFRSSVVAEDKESQASRPVCPLIYQQELEKSNSWNNKNLLNSLPHQEYQLCHYCDTEELTLRHQSIAESLNIPDDFTNSSRPDHVPLSALEDLYPFEACHFSSSTYSFNSTYTPIVVEEAYNFQDISPHDAENIKNDAPESLIACGLRDLSNEGTNPSETCSNLHSDSCNTDAFTISSVPSTVIEEFCVVEGSSLPVLLGDHFDRFATHQDIQSQLTSTNLSESLVFSLREFPDNSVSTSSGNFYANDCSYFGKLQMKQVVQQPMRTYTKVQKLGSVGRSVDLKRFQNYEELKSAIACMFGLEGLYNNPKHSEWKFVYVDQENDVLLLGDDPWDEFVNCVRCIRILSLSEVEQMSQEGLQFINRY